MEAGHSTQQHSNLAALYPRSKNLQTNIIEFFIVVVHICLRFHRYTQKSGPAKFVSSLNDSDIEELRSSLIAWSKAIQEEITTLVAQTVETEAKSNSAFRALMSSNSKKAFERQRQIALRKIRNRCSTYDYETPWRQIRKAGNTCLYKELPQYNQWIVAPASKTLVLVEKLGYGKSVTLANMVDDLNLRIDPKTCGLAYFFCRHDIPESKHAETIMGALLRQIISPLEHLLDESQVMNLYDLPQPLGLMRHVVPSGYVLYIIVDGLDICSPSERKTVTEQLELMATHFNVHICISRRLEPDTKLQSEHDTELQSEPDTQLRTIAKDFSKATVIRLPNNDSDIETYVEAQLEAAILKKKLVLGEPALILEITNALLDGSQHMFLWVALQIQSLCMMQTDHDIREALVNLPKDLPEIYSQILQQANCLNQALRSNIFKLILAARRPLTRLEMREALSVIPGNTAWDRSKLLNSVDPSLASCGCLITVDEEEHTISTVHPSVNLFLLQDTTTTPEMVRGIHFTMEEAQSLMSSIIITYLGYGIFGTELALRPHVINVGALPDHVMESTKHAENGLLAATLKILRSRKKTKFDASHTFVPNLRSPRPPTMDDFLFQHYAKPYALQHLSDLPDVSCANPESLLKMLENGAIVVKSDEEAIGVLWLMLQPPGRSDVVTFLNEIGFDAMHGTSDASMTLSAQLFFSAIANGRTQAIKYLMDLYCPMIERGPDSMQPNANLAFLALWRHYVQQAFDPHAPKHEFLGIHPLKHAIECYQTRSLETLLSYDVHDINHGGSALWMKPIGQAARLQNIGALKILLSAEHRGKLKLTLEEAEELMDLIEPIADDSVPSLLSCIKMMHPNASLGKSRRR